VRHFPSVEDAAARLKDEIERGILKRGDIVLVKGSRAMRLDRVVRGLIDK
jgi:UDP-N-acetylmuramyl pentapeptide synthase